MLYKDFDYIALPSSKAIIREYTGKNTEISIPSMINGYSVVGIAEKAFAENNKMTSVIIPPTVTTIGYRAFGNCYNLSCISLPNSLSEIADDAFDNCVNLRTIKCNTNSFAHQWCRDNGLGDFLSEKMTKFKELLMSTNKDTPSFSTPEDSKDISR